MTDYSHIGPNITKIRENLATAALAAGRDPADVRLIAVTKTYPAEAVAAAVAAGIKDVGENRVQEAVQKIAELRQLDGLAMPTWHLIGSLQSNKARIAVEHFDVIHSVDSVRLAKAINRHCASLNKLMEILIQVNISGEESKSGVAPEQLEKLLTETLEECPQLRIMGLMTIPPLDLPETARPVFKKLHQLMEDMKKKINHPRLIATELSMGMSGDFPVAIEEGSTMVRVGTAIFGART